MKKKPAFAPIALSALLLAAAAASPLTGAGATPTPSAPKIGGPAPDFTLPAAANAKPVALKELLGKSRAVTVMFIATKCPVSNAYNERMAALAKDYAARGIAFVGINSNKAELAPEAARKALGGEDMAILAEAYATFCGQYGYASTPTFGQWIGNFRGLS